jgi:hypothetical protein
MFENVLYFKLIIIIQCSVTNNNYFSIAIFTISEVDISYIEVPHQYFNLKRDTCSL